MEQLGSSFKLCLLCGEGTGEGHSGHDKSEASKLGGIVGGVNCVSLERQLEKMFILLNVLEVPRDWCEATLKRRGDDGGEGDNNPDKWFKLCDKCVEGNVKKAWTAYQNILRWQTKLLSLKLKIMEGMRRSILEARQNNTRLSDDGWEMKGRQVDYEIKRYLFPELFTKVEQEEEAQLDDLADLMEFECDANVDYQEAFEDTTIRNSLSVEVEPTKHRIYTGRKRGRPRKSDQKTLTNDLKIEDSSSSPSKNNPLNLVEVNFDLDPKNLRENPVSNDIDDDYQPEVQIDHAEDLNDNDDSDSDYQPEVATRKTTTGRRPGRPRIHPPGYRPSRPPKTTTPSKRRPGRPRIHPPKPPPRHGIMGRRPLFAPGTCRNRNLLKAKKFHWSRCAICDARYTNTEDYTAHMALHAQKQDNPSPSKGPLDCPHCPFPARDPQELDYHLRRRHSKKPQVLQQNHSCPKCPFTTHRWKYLKAHLDIQHPTLTLSELGPDLSLKCQECGLQFPNMNNYQTHLRMKHPKDISEGPVTCPQCGIKFLSGSLLAYHINSKHKKSLRHICDECGKGYEFLNGLKRHKEAHLKKRDPSRKREHVCEECGLDFWDVITFKKHYKTVHCNKAPKVEGLQAPADDKVFQCKYCEVKSPLASFIKRHTVEEHKGEMAWKCDLCERRYTNQQGLKRHLRLNHGGAGEEVACPHCGKRFAGEEYMRDHVRRFCRLKDLTGMVEGEGVNRSNVNLGDPLDLGGSEELKFISEKFE